MIDPHALRDSLDTTAARLAARGHRFDRERYLALETERRRVQTLTEQRQARRNALARAVGQARAKGEDATALIEEATRIGEELAALEAQLARAQEELHRFLAEVPNPPHPSVPEGSGPEHNVEVRRHGTPPRFSFRPRDHVEIGEALSGIDFEAAAAIAGSRFAVLRGAVASLHRALAQFMLDVHVREHGYSEVWAPWLVNAASMYGTGQLPKFEQDLFCVPRGEERWYLIPTAEVPVTNLVRERIVPREALPLRYVCHSPCFRSEAGAYGRDTRGMIRQHQFDKVELVWIEHPARSYDALERLTRHAETILERLGLAYRTVVLCTGDMGFAAAKTYDIEVWLPGGEAYREISSCSNFEAFQARRMQARFRNDKGRPELVHTLNGSGLAVGRTLIAVLENYQNEDGSVTVPLALRPYLGGLERIAAG